MEHGRVPPRHRGDLPNATRASVWSAETSATAVAATAPTPPGDGGWGLRKGLKRYSRDSF